MIHFTCGNCGGDLDADDSFGGRRIICTRCDAETAVPKRPPEIMQSEHGLRLSPSKPLPSMPSSVLEDLRRRSAYPTTRMLLILVAVMSVVAGGVLGAVFLTPSLFVVGVAFAISCFFYQIFLDIADCQLRLVRAAEREKTPE